MKKRKHWPLHGALWRAALLAGVVAGGVPVQAQSAARVIVTNDDLPGVLPNTVSFYSVAPDGTVSLQSRLNTGGYGNSGGYFSTSRIKIVRDGNTDCAYVSNAWSGDISGISLNDRQVTGHFSGADTDLGPDNGISLTLNDDHTYLYAGYTTSNTIGTFAVEPGCMLTYVGSIVAAGKNAGWPSGMAARGKLLVVAYVDGSIESFNIASGVPVSNGDLQNTPGAAFDYLPSGVQITKNGRFAIFGDNATFTAIEVSDLSGGKLATPVLYEMPTALNSANIMLSPDETLLYIVNNASGQITASFFNSATGVVSPGCVSPPMKFFTKKWTFSSDLATVSDSGTGGQLYVTEIGAPSYIGVVNVQSNGAECALAEDPQSPILNPHSGALISFSAYTPQ
jgi:6-phosphogluconolactonase (cycloisomerase 2 family)